MNKKIHPTILFLNRFSLPVITAILLAYIYALVVARSEFSRSMFMLFLFLGLIALGLIIKGVYQTRYGKDPADKESEEQQR